MRGMSSWSSANTFPPRLYISFQALVDCDIISSFQNRDNTIELYACKAERRITLFLFYSQIKVRLLLTLHSLGCITTKLIGEIMKLLIQISYSPPVTFPKRIKTKRRKTNQYYSHNTYEPRELNPKTFFNWIPDP